MPRSGETKTQGSRFLPSVKITGQLEDRQAVRLGDSVETGKSPGQGPGVRKLVGMGEG